jgi:purine-nucleoside phosphorylase
VIDSMTGRGLYDQVHDVVASVRERAPGASPHIGVVLGSGLGAFAERPSAVSIPFADLRGLPAATVHGHAGRLVLDGPVAILAGRLHLYEGFPPADVVLPIRMLVALGCRTIVLTNACGAVATDLAAGDLVLITDHLDPGGAGDPLRGPNDDRLGPRFPDLREAWDPELRALARREADRFGVALREGVYAFNPGPSYETPAQVRALRALGADVVGMSTVPEAIAAGHMGARVLGIACVTNAASGTTPLRHDEVVAVAARAAPRLTALLEALVAAVSAGSATGTTGTSTS